MGNNDASVSQIEKDIKKNSGSKIGMIFIVLILLQYYLFPVLTSAWILNDAKLVNNIFYFHTIISYVIIVFSLIVFREFELDMFRDYFSLGIIVATCFLRAGLGGSDETVFKALLILIGIILTNYIIVNRKSIIVPDMKSVFIGVLWSVGVTVVLSLLRVLLDPGHRTLPANILAYIINISVFQLSFVTIIEEAYFRGLLFGFLLMSGYKENTALFIQAILFWGIHYVRFGDPVLFWVIIPIYTLSATLVIKKYKMLYLTIMMHTIYNVFGGILVALI